MYISISEHHPKEFINWSNAHPPASNDNADDFAGMDALLIPSEAPHDPWLVPGVANTL